MRVLWVATKPPSPPVDGGRVLLAHTLAALRARGAEVTLVAPPAVEPRSPRACLLAAVARSVAHGMPLAIARHVSPALAREVARLVAGGGFDVVHAEQLHALPQCGAARRAGVPVFLRAQNVESDLWSGRALLHRWLGPLLRREARRLARWEAEAVGALAGTVALSEHDAGRLRALAGTPAGVHRVAAPFAAAAQPSGTAVAGAPAVVLFGSRGWFPNRDGATWFVRAVWPRVRARLPRALLHVFGIALDVRVPGVVEHGAPDDSRAAFPAGGVLAVPLRVASGIRMKILEAWTRGVPVVATPEAAVGLDAEPGRELLVAADGDGFADALAALHTHPDRGRALTAAGRALLAGRHRPELVADELLALYAAVA
jgi:hypothetical protein